MRIKYLEFKNIGSFGEKLQTIEFPSDGHLVLIKGPSGVGKSTYLNITKLLLFGKADGIPKNAVANRVNRNGYIKGIVTEGEKTYIIERGFQPTYLNIYKEDGTSLDMVGVKDAQSYIDTEIVKMSYTLYSNIISLSLINFKSFLKMSPFDRREIIDRVFSLEIINHIFEFIKKDIKDLASNINMDNASIFSLTSTIESSKKELESIKESNDSSISSSIQTNMNMMLDIENKLKLIQEKYQEISNGTNNMIQVIQTLNQELTNVNFKIKQINEKIGLFNLGCCPTCGTKFDTDEFKEMLHKLEDEKAEKENLKERIEAKIKEVQEAKAPYDQAIQVLVQKSREFSAERLRLDAETNALKNSVKNSAEYQSIQNIINNTEESISVVKKRITSNTNKINNLEVLQNLFSIDGVKKQVIENYLPKLNAEIKDTLIRLNFPYTLTFDSQFNSHVTDLGNDISVETLSVGEHRRVDLAVLCSVFKLIKRKYPSINVFTLDEVLSSVDPENSTEILKFLKEFSSEMKINTYVISHINMTEDLFDDCIEIYKDMRFSDVMHYNSQN